jgi:ethanolamine utilization protein EutN
MRIAEVIGTVTLSRIHPTLEGGRWVIGVPYSLKALRDGLPPDGEDVVIYDNLGAGYGQRVGVTEGTEAFAPFYPERKPIDAFCSLLIDQLVIKES